MVEQTITLKNDDGHALLIANIGTGEIRTDCGDSSYDMKMSVQEFLEFAEAISNATNNYKEK